jgi:hypothetical protein
LERIVVATRIKPNQQRITKARRRDEARRQRQELLQKQARRRRIWRWGLLASASVVVAGLVLGIVLASSGPKTKTSAGSLPGMLATTAPWPPNTEEMPQRVVRLGLPGPGEALHIHSRLELYVHGQKVPIPAEIGITSEITSSLHTHDATGVIHVESSEQRTFTLGEFFDVWGVRLNQSCLGAYCDGDEGTLRIFVNGEPIDGSIRTLPLRDQTEIVLTFGRQSELPEPIPSEFSFGG